MKNAIPRYSCYKTKYGSELLIDVVDLQYTRKFLTQGKVHILTYYDITFITEGEGEFTIGNRTHLAVPQCRASRGTFWVRRYAYQSFSDGK